MRALASDSPSSWPGHEQRDHGKRQGRQQVDVGQQASEDDAEQHESEQHQHLDQRLAELHEAVAELLVEQHNRQAADEGSEETVAAGHRARDVGEQHQPDAEQRLVLAADAEAGVDAHHQPGSTVRRPRRRQGR